MLYLDLETRSQCDLGFHGLRRYAEDPSTEVMCMAYAVDDGDIKLWWADEPWPQNVTDYFKSNGKIMAHNASFEQHLFDFVIAGDYDFTPPEATQWVCSMAMALVSGFAGGLDAAAAGVGLTYRKHTDGTRLIREYCAVGHKDIFDPENARDRELMGAYNISDVEVMRALCKHLRPLTDLELEEYHLNARINDRGLPIDVDFCTAALGYSKEVAEDANRQIAELTGGAMTKATQRKARDEWLLPKLTEYQLTLLEVYKKGEKKISLDQDHRRYLMDCDDLDHDARKLLEYIDNAGSSALTKFAVAAHQHCAGRVHNTFLWNGAGRTGRYSGKNLQPHNIRRDVFSHNEAESLIQDIIEGLEIDAPADTMARLLRSMIHHPDGLCWVDWSSVEGRVAPWLTDSAHGELKLELYRRGKDVYVVTAAKMFGLTEAEIDKDMRQSGKIAELSLQFGGSHNALISMAKNYGMSFTDEDAKRIVKLWRMTNPWAETIWHQYDEAIRGAVNNTGTPFEVGRVTYQYDGHSFLWCRLPSERLLAYPKPQVEPYVTPWGEERFGVTFQSHFKPAAGGKPIRIHARGALLFQNTVQAVAADLLREALLEADDAGLDIILHCHDEILIQGSQADGERLNEIMLTNPWWAGGLPLATGGIATGKRWGK